MAYYNDEVQIYEGELSIFKRDLDIANKNTRRHEGFEGRPFEAVEIVHRRALWAVLYRHRRAERLTQ